MEVIKKTPRVICKRKLLVCFVLFLTSPSIFVCAEETKDQHPVLKTAKNEEYSKPVYFDSMENILPTMEFEYDLTREEGKSLRVGDAVIDEKSFYFILAPVSKFHPKMSSILAAKDAGKMFLIVGWPETLQQGGVLEMISHRGNVLWTDEISEEKRGLWKSKLQAWRKSLEEKNVKSESFSKTSVFSTQYGTELKVQDLKSFNESFRFCLTQTQGRSQSRLCSQRYVLRPADNQFVMAKLKTPGQPRVLLQSQSAELKQNMKVDLNMPTSFFAELANGMTYEFISLPNKLNLMEMTDAKEANKIRIMAWGVRPTTPSKLLNPDNYSALTRAIGFESTIGDKRKFWEALIDSEDPKIYLPGQGGGLFAQGFAASEVPRANARPYLEIHTPQGTYNDEVKLFGRKNPEVKVTSTENSIEMNPEDSTLFLWHFKAEKRGEINRSYLSMESEEGKEYKAFYELYKGFPRELSFRLSGLVQPNGQSLFLTEGAYNQWFEDFLGWTNYWVGRQRWGVSAKYFRSLTKLTVNSTTGVTADLTVANVDLKYRLVPGLWGRDETLGAMLDYQSVGFGKISAPMLGVGAFWARSMPKVFDNFFNLVPLMRFPKWVDMEFIYYPLPLSPHVSLQTNFALNFHGKVLWTERWFGEAGFGLKRYAIVDTQLREKAALDTFYGTVGLGLNF
ncbi:MAG: hypothetical protein ACXVBQ_14015 [Pseudobdellovibrionaceae bacterium]